MKFQFILLLCVAFSFSALAQNYATVHIYREHKISSAASIPILLNGKRISVLDGKSKITYKIYSTGNLKVECDNIYFDKSLRNSSINLTIEHGKDYYLKVSKKDIFLISEVSSYEGSKDLSDIHEKRHFRAEENPNSPIISTTTKVSTDSIKKIEVVEKKESSPIISDVDQNIPENTSPNSEKFALIIGNEDYSSFQTDLNKEVNVAFAERDARTFKEYAVKTLGIPEENIILKINAKTVEMSRVVEKMNVIAKNLDGKGELIVFYAGHGFPDMQTKEPHLIPVDCSGTDLKFAIKLSTLYEKLSQYPCQRVTVFLDACFSGGARNVGLLSSRGVKIKPKDELLKGNLVVFSASSESQSAMPYKEKGHGLFTYFLLKKLQESKGNVTYEELSNYLQTQVGVKSAMINDSEQNPQTNVSSSVENTWKTWKMIPKK